LSRSIRTFPPFLSFRGTRCQDDRDGPDGGSPAWPFGAVLLLEVRAAGALVAAKPPPSHVFERVVLTAAEESGVVFTELKTLGPDETSFKDKSVGPGIRYAFLGC